MPEYAKPVAVAQVWAYIFLYLKEIPRSAIWRVLNPFG